MCSYIRDERSVRTQGALVRAYIHKTRESGMHVLQVFMCIAVNMRFFLWFAVCYVCSIQRHVFHLCLCVCVCVWISISTRIYTEMSILGAQRHQGIPVRAHTYIHAYIHAHIHACMHTYIHAYFHIYIPTYLSRYLHIHAYRLHEYMHAQTYTHTFIHTYLFARAWA